MNYFDHLNYAFSIAQFKGLNTATRMTHLAILHQWNAFRRPSSFSLSDRELQNLTALSSNAITAAKRQLKNLGLIDFKATKAHSTIYKVPTNARFESAVNAQPTQDSMQSAQFSTTKNSNQKKDARKDARVKEVDYEIQF